jgi:hypothetical protein
LRDSKAYSVVLVPPDPDLDPYFTDGLSLMRLTDRLAALEAVPTPAGDGWRVFIQWVSGRMQYVSGFESLQEAEDWIMNESERWLRALMEAQL